MVGHVTPYKIRKARYLLRSFLGARRMLLFMVEQVFPLRGEVWSMHKADTQCTVGKRGGQRAGKNFYV